jgi:hypothetical protein
MIDTERFVLPFKWREFGKWFSALGSITENNKFQIKIKDVCFEASERRLEGIRIQTKILVPSGIEKKIFLVAFLADMESLELFEPFVGIPNRVSDFGLSGRMVELRSGRGTQVDLFIPDQGWILPSIWRFLVQSVGLKKKDDVKMPEVIIFGFEPGQNQRPVLFACRPFDYFGNARRLKEDLALKDFFRLLNVSPEASEAEIQRAYIVRCREFQAESGEEVPRELYRRRGSVFAKIKNGYQIWTDKTRERNSD